MTIRQILQRYKDVEVDLLLAHVLKQPKEFLYVHPETKVTKEQYNKITTLVERRKNGEPIAYLVGYKYFYGLKFKINRQVLTPRPETEWLVDKALSIATSDKSRVKNKKNVKPFAILDVGTGSGCIAISIARQLQSPPPRQAGVLLLATGGEKRGHALRPPSLIREGGPDATSGTEGLPRVAITASDISSTALKVAQTNANTHKVVINFVNSDLFSKIRGTYNIITANLPYVPQGMYELLYHNLKYEPKVAITDGGEVWDMYYRFFGQLPKRLATGGVALLEIDDGSKPDLQKMLKKLLPNYKTTFYKDLNGLWRYLEITP